MQVVGARVGPVQRLFRTAAVVVGQGHVDLATVRVHRHPFGSVHRRRPGAVSGSAGIEQHLGLTGKAVLCGQSVLAMHQRQPLTAAVGVEAGNVQRALIQQAAVVGVRPGREATAGDELVDILALVSSPE